MAADSRESINRVMRMRQYLCVALLRRSIIGARRAHHHHARYLNSRLRQTRGEEIYAKIAIAAHARSGLASSWPTAVNARINDASKSARGW